jgi:ERCC4-type nuclease
MDEAAAPKIIVDTRERGYSGLLSALGASVEDKMLEVGDFLCSATTVIERKARTDFETSVMDGRLFSQLANMKRSFPVVIIVVEGERIEGGPLTRAALMGAYASIMTDYGASVFFTRNAEASAELIYHIAKHEQCARKKETPVFAKRKSLTIPDSQRAVVESLPMVGPALAKRLLMHFGSPEGVISAGEERLCEVEGVGKKRATAIRRILTLAYGEEE